MAPTRALLRCAAALLQRRADPHLLRISPSTASRFSAKLQHSSPSQFKLASPTSRCYSSQSDTSPPELPDYLNEAEAHIFNKILANLEPIKLEVQDISGGCGSMYALSIESPKFNGLSVVKQHKLVNSVLADEIRSWHGVQLRTKAA